MSEAAVANNGAQSQESESRARPYVVLEQGCLLDAVLELFKRAEVGLQPEQWDRVERAATAEERPIFVEVARVPSRNSKHALTQAGRRYEVGVTPPLVAVSERMFRPRQVDVEADPRVRVR